jgi:hypothetical protein
VVAVWADQTAPDHGVSAGHLAGRGPADTDFDALAGHSPLIYGLEGFEDSHQRATGLRFLFIALVGRRR